MSEKQRKEYGYEKVRNYILTQIRNRECPFDPFVRIHTEEVAREIGISQQSVNRHIRTMVLHGVIKRDRRYYFSRRIPTETEFPSVVIVGMD